MEYTSKLHEKSSGNIMGTKQFTVSLIFTIIHKFADSAYIFPLLSRLSKFEITIKILKLVLNFIFLHFILLT